MTTQAPQWIDHIIQSCPRRVAGSASERKAHELMAKDAEALGLKTELVPFRFNRSIYANMAMHFLLATLATGLLAIQPAAALIVHLLVAVSYWLDSNKKHKLLRRLFPFHDSQNLVATKPATSPLRHRVVFIAHIDAAFTGLIFHPTMIKLATAPPPLKILAFMRKSMFVATLAVFGLAIVDAVALAVGLSTILWIVAGLLTIPAFLTFAFNAQVVLTNKVVPGANDNLTGCWSALELARRLMPDCPEDVELVFVATGCEEAGTGGSWALSQQRLGVWEPEKTSIFGIDSLSNGALHYFIEGELLTQPPPSRLVEAIKAHAPQVAPFEIPSGATDSLAFLVRGFDAISFGCVDTEIGAPRNYHWPTDDVAHLDQEQLKASVDQIERVARAVMLGTA